MRRVIVDQRTWGLLALLLLSACGRYGYVHREFDMNGVHDCFHKDLVTNAVTLVSRGRDGTPANAATFSCFLSGDGHSIAAATNASNLLVNDSNGAYDLYVFTVP